MNTARRAQVKSVTEQNEPKRTRWFMKARMTTGWVLAIALTSTTAICQVPSLTPAQQLPGLPPPGSQNAQATNWTSAPSPLFYQSIDSTQAKPGAYVSPWLAEVIKMTRAGIDDDVTLAYVGSAAGTFNLQSGQIIYLRDLGASNDLINAMLQHDQDLNMGIIPLVASTVPSGLEGGALGFSAASARSPQAAGPSGDGIPERSGSASIVAPDGPTPSILAENGGPGWGAGWAWSGGWTFSEDNVPEQPDNLRIRLPYPVKLTDPIVMLRLP